MRKILPLKKGAILFTGSVIFFLTCTLFAFSRWSQNAASATLIDGLKQCAHVTNSGMSLIACTKQTVEEQLQRHTTAQLMNEITSNNLPMKYFDCHSIAHVIGIETYNKYDDVEQALAQCTSGCYDGCLHGVMGGAVQKAFGANDPGQDISHMNVDQIESIGAKYCSTAGLCHGIGHVLFAALEDFNKASDACSTISSGLAKESCTSGVFMQGAGDIGDTLVLGTSSLTLARIPSGDYAYPCDTVPLKYQHSCFLFLAPYQNIAFKEAGVQDLEQKKHLQIDACERFNGYTRSYCFEGIGRFAIYLLPQADEMSADAVASLCQSMPTESDQKSCILGNAYVSRGYKNVAQAYGLCSALTQKDLRDFCFFANFAYAGPQNNPTKNVSCPDFDSGTQCSQAFAAFQKIRATLPDYRYGLYGKIK